MSDVQLKRRSLLLSGALTLSTGLSGCLRFFSSDDTPTATETVKSGVPTAQFEFQYDESGGNGGGSLLIRHSQGDPIPAEKLKIRSTDGHTATWNMLGSTAKSAGDPVRKGDTARIDATVLNWPADIRPSDSIRIIYVSNDGSPTTLDRYTPSSTITETSDSYHFSDNFEDGDISGWENPVNAWSVTKEDAFSGTYSALLDYESTEKTMLTARRISAFDITTTTSVFFRNKVLQRNNAWILRVVDQAERPIVKVANQNPAGKVYDYSNGMWVPSDKKQIGHDGQSPAWTGILMDFDPDTRSVHVHEHNPSLEPLLDERVQYNPESDQIISGIEIWNEGTTNNTYSSDYFDDFIIQR